MGYPTLCCCFGGYVHNGGWPLRLRTTPSSATVEPVPSYPGLGIWTGCACQIWTPRRVLPRCWAGSTCGRWSVTIDDGEVTSRSYIKATFILVTEYRSPEGTARITEWMPIDGRRNDVVRRVECTSGHVTVRQHLRVRFGYGRIVPWASQTADPENQRVLHFVAGPDSLTLHAPSLPAGHDRNMRTTTSLPRVSGSTSPSRGRDRGTRCPRRSTSMPRREHAKFLAELVRLGEVDELYDFHVRRSLLTLRCSRTSRPADRGTRRPRCRRSSEACQLGLPVLLAARPAASPARRCSRPTGSWRGPGVA